MRALEIKKFLNNVISYGYEQKEDDPFSEYEASSENASTNIDGIKHLRVIIIYDTFTYSQECM